MSPVCQIQIQIQIQIHPAVATVQVAGCTTTCRRPRRASPAAASAAASRASAVGWAPLYRALTNPTRALRGAASVASCLAAVLTEMYLCNVCSSQEILRRNGRG
jgi:hypothetical protein